MTFSARRLTKNHFIAVSKKTVGAARRRLLQLSLFSMVAMCSAGHALAARMQVGLDTGVVVTVDNISSIPNSHVATLVLAADRSTRDGCPFDPPDRKGLITPGDRVIVSDTYVAWLDLTVESANSGFPGAWARSGELTGFWTLDPATQWFRNWTPASIHNCWNWPRNELIVGSASPDGTPHWWDKFAPPTEHVVHVANNGAGPLDLDGFMAFHYAQRAPIGYFRVTVDGSEYQPGRIHFVYEALMLNPFNSPYVRHADYPYNTSYGVINVQMEYQFQPNQIVVAWRFKPTVDILVSNLFTAMWTAYAPYSSPIPPECLNASPGLVNRPANYFTPLMWFAAAVPVVPKFDGSILPAGTTVFPPNSAPVEIGAPCGPINHDVDTWQAEDINNTVIGDGTWIRIGDDPNLGAVWDSERTITMLNLEHVPSGIGTIQAPFNIRYTRGTGWNEVRDGTYGLFFCRGPYTEPSKFLRLQGGMWYYSSFALPAAVVY
jgi:hypothetical protein